MRQRIEERYSTSRMMSESDSESDKSSQVVIHDSPMNDDVKSQTCDMKPHCSDKYEELLHRLDSLEDRCKLLEKKCDFLEADRDLHRDLLVKQSKKLLYLEERTVDIISRSMSDNILVTGCPEKNSNPETDLMQFIKKNIGVEMKNSSIMKAHRTGPSRENGPRTLVAKLEPKTKDEILKKSSTELVNKKGLYINQQKPEALVEKSKQLRFRLKQTKIRHQDVHPAPEVKIYNGEVYCNKQRVRNKTHCPSTKEILGLTHDDRAALKKMKFHKSNGIIDDGSTFVGYSRKVNNFDEVRRAYQAIKLQVADADDIMCSFNVKDSYGYPVLEYHDDAEHGGGSRILSAIQEAKAENTVVFVSRHFYGKHIGKKRFLHIQKSAADAITVMRQRSP